MVRFIPCLKLRRPSTPLAAILDGEISTVATSEIEMSLHAVNMNATAIAQESLLTI